MSDTDTPRAGDAERLQAIRERMFKPSENMPDAEHGFLLRLVDSRDAALRVAQAEIEQLRAGNAVLEAVAEAARRTISKQWFSDDHPLVEALARLDAAPAGEGWRPIASGNDNAHPPIPVPSGGFPTNEDEARWLEQTLIMRFEETVRNTLNVNAKLTSGGLYDLLLMSLNAASRRRSLPPPPAPREGGRE